MHTIARTRISFCEGKGVKAFSGTGLRLSPRAEETARTAASSKRYLLRCMLLLKRLRYTRTSDKTSHYHTTAPSMVKTTPISLPP